MTPIRPAIAGLLATTILPGCYVPLERAEIDFTTRDATVGVERVEIETANGAITVRVSAGSEEIDVRAVKFALASSAEEAERRARDVVIEVGRKEGAPHVLAIRALPPGGETMDHRGARFEVAVPDRVALDLRTSNGAIEVEDIQNEVQVRSSNGALTLRRLGGDFEGRTSNGRVEISEIVGDVQVETSNGGVTLSQIDAVEVHATTRNGRIRAHGIHGDVHLHTRNGAIELEVDRVGPARVIEATTSNGSVVVTVAETLEARLALRTSHGKLRTEFPEGAHLETLHTDRDSLEALVNGGGGEVTVETSNGSLTFRMGREQAARRGPDRRP